MISRELQASLGLLLLRVMTGLGMMLHGYPKLFKGGVHGLASGLAADGIPLPTVAAWCAALAEFGGGVLLVLGLKTRVAAALVFVTMTVAAFVHHASDPIRAKELALAYWTMSGALLLLGGGRFSLDKS